MTAQRIRVAVLGTGRAGKARIAAINAHPDCQLISAESMRNCPESSSIKRSDIDLIIVATENARHFELAHASLAAGKHVAVEFPLCVSASEAKRLFALAKSVDRVLHLEVITLLTAGFATFADRLAAVDGQVSLVSTFTGGSYRWIGDEIRAGNFGQLALGRLHVLRALIGEMSLDSAAVRVADDGFDLNVTLRHARGTVSLRERRQPGLKRSWSMVANTEAGQFALPPAQRDERLFARDSDVCIGQITGITSHYIAEQDVIDAISMAVSISAAAAVSIGRLTGT